MLPTSRTPAETLGRDTHRRAGAPGRADPHGDTRAAARCHADGQSCRSPAAGQRSKGGRPGGPGARPGRPGRTTRRPTQPGAVGSPARRRRRTDRGQRRPAPVGPDRRRRGRLRDDLGRRTGHRQLAGRRHRGRSAPLRTPLRRLLHRDRPAGGTTRLRHRRPEGHQGAGHRPPGNRRDPARRSAIWTARRSGWRSSSAPPTPPLPVPRTPEPPPGPPRSRRRKHSASRRRNSPNRPSGRPPATG